MIETEIVMPVVYGGSSVSDYNELNNKPSINGVTLEGNKELSDIGAATSGDISQLSQRIDNLPVPNVSGQIQEHNTNPDAHTVLFGSKIGLPSYDPITYKLTFTAGNGATVIVDLPIEVLGLTYNPDTKEMIYTNPDGSKITIPLSDFVDIYVGSIGDNIQITVDSGNVIRANLLDGSIDLGKLSAELQQTISQKANKDLSNVTDADFKAKAAVSGIGEIVDSLTSLSTTAALSARQGFLLNQVKAERTYLSTYYWERLTATTARLSSVMPSNAASNYMQTTTTNTTFDWSGGVSITRTIEIDTHFTPDNRLEEKIRISASRNASVEFGVRVKYNGAYLTGASVDKQVSGFITIDGNNQYSLPVEVDLSLTLGVLDVVQGGSLVVEIYTRQVNAQSLTLRWLCGANGEYSQAYINAGAVSLNTQNIADNAITMPKLDSEVRGLLNNMPTSNVVHPTAIDGTSVPTSQYDLNNEFQNYGASINNLSNTVNRVITPRRDNISDIAKIEGYADKNGTFTNSIAWRRTDFERIDSFSGYVKTYSGNSASNVPAVLFYSEKSESGFISAIFGDTLQSVNIYELNRIVSPPQGANYFIINCNFNRISDGLLDVIISTNYLDERVTNIENKLPSDILAKTIVVRKIPGVGEYATIKDAIAVSVKGDTIKIFEGVYEEQGLQVKDDTTLIGIGIVEIRGYLPPESTTALIDATSTLDVYKNVSLKNLIITGRNIRYPIHSDMSSTGNSYQEFINCTFIHYGNIEVWQYRTNNNMVAPNDPKSVFRATSAFGGGTRSGDKRLFVGCKFESNVRAFAMHNNSNFNTTNGASFCELRNCEFISHGIDFDGNSMNFLSSIHIYSADSKSIDEILFSACKINGYMTFYGTLTHKIIHDSENIKVVYNTVGSGNFMNDTISQLIADTSKYVISTKELNSFKNVSDTTILKGYAVKLSGIGITKMIDTDLAENFLGVALDTIEPGKSGNVAISGFLYRPYFEGIRTTLLTAGAKIGVNSLGRFGVNSGAIIGTVVDNQNIHLKKY